MQQHRTQILLGTALAAAALIAVAAQIAPGSPASRPVCKASQLRAKLLDSNGAAGTVLFSVTLQNKGSACKLKGYPALGIANAQGLVTSHVMHGGLPVQTSTPKLVNLAHLDKASVLISFKDVPVGNETHCPAGDTIILRPPGGWRWLTIKAATEACGHGTLHESPVLAGVHSSQ